MAADEGSWASRQSAATRIEGNAQYARSNWAFLSRAGEFSMFAPYKGFDPSRFRYI